MTIRGEIHSGLDRCSYCRQVAMAASVVTPTADVIKMALKTCGIKHVQQWCSKHLAASLCANET